MYKNTKEIKEVFGIDITEKNRTIPFVALRAFYTEIREKELNGIPNHFEIIAKELNFKRVNVYNMLFKAKLFKEDRYCKILFKAFETKDKSLIQEYHNSVRTLKTEKQAERYLQRDLKEFIPAQRVKVISKFDKNKSLMSNLKLSEFLRKNNVKKHEVWDTPVKNISQNQWQQVREINSKMFDKYVNN